MKQVFKLLSGEYIHSICSELRIVKTKLEIMCLISGTQRNKIKSELRLHGNGIEETLMRHSARWHKTCQLKSSQVDRKNSYHLCTHIQIEAYLITCRTNVSSPSLKCFHIWYWYEIGPVNFRFVSSHCVSSINMPNLCDRGKMTA